ncbi:bacteriocin immunity protein [Pediococcus stilesii]|uniref:Bacteriocin immunity protein n=1 Tax=Pediococcus stilesii TaxID=331679 RepID=A0A5R9BW14_9LACO|nr:bacteriocin immunity protein [Pediococcus stilesii]TLQ04483.1 bacteriocin immunity protein [Pediococcus stilesii]
MSIKQYHEHEQQLLQTINTILTKNISADERAILKNAQEELIRSVYFPSVTGELQGALTPLAVGGHLSKDVADLYKLLLDPQLMDHHLGGGIMMSFGTMFR